ncbi:hypothetical protein PG988_008266 [Apiospora saccharicola]
MHANEALGLDTSSQLICDSREGIRVCDPPVTKGSGSAKVTTGAQEYEHGCDKGIKRGRKSPRETGMPAVSKDEALWCEDAAWHLGHVSRRHISQMCTPRWWGFIGMAIY